MPFRIVPIVEGHGEVPAVPILFRRVIAELNPGVAVDLARSIRRPRGTLLKEGGIEDAVKLGALEMGEAGAIFVLLDSEGDCPAELAPPLLARAQNARPDKQVSLVLAHQEFEAWFLAAASSLQGGRGLSEEIEDHDNPESVHGCKEWLEGWMRENRKYSETIDQPALTATFDLRLARKAPSFDKFYREVEQICRQAILPVPH
jgi:Domain of unknown function (DUF4276)